MTTSAALVCPWLGKAGVRLALVQPICFHLTNFCCVIIIIIITSSSAAADRPRELGDFKRARVNGGTDNHSLKGFSQVSPLPLTDPHHMVIK